MDKQLLKELLTKYESGTCTEEEVALLENWYLQWNPNEDLQLSEYLIENAVDSVWSKLQDDIRDVRTIKLWPRIAAAAAVLIFIGIGVASYLSHNKILTPAQIAARIVPGNNKAVLTLSNGLKIELTNKSAGAVAKQSGVSIAKTSNDEVVYTGSQQANTNTAVEYNTLNTPNGGQFQLVLPDGTHVWLNATSSIRYPTVFNNHERLVEITGEAYFEVAKNPNLPFIVKVNNETQIKVLGTHFNVNAYTNEAAVHTTLLEGSIKLTADQLSAKLSPGEETVSGHYSDGSSFLKKADNVNLDQVVAWKDGLFNFKNMPFDEVMRQLSRWYNVDVSYETQIPDIKFAGELGRDVSFSKVLLFLSKTGIHYRLEQDNKLVITK